VPQRRPAAPARLAAAIGLCLVSAAAGCGRDAAAPGGTSGGPVPAAAPAHDDAPLLLLVTIDTLRADRLGCYGRAAAGTPAWDALAAGGVRFDEAQTTSPLTLPAHTSLLAGRTLAAHGVFLNGTYSVPETIPLLAERFRSAGFATAAFVSSPVLARRHGLARGFDVYDDAIPAPPRRPGIVSHYDERAGTATVARAAAWLAVQRGRKAFAWVHLWEPHVPYAPPPEFAARFPDRYQGEVAAADAALGMLLEQARALGRDRLLVVATSDHGEGLGEHGEPTHGVFLYRATMHVPLVVHGPAYGVKPAVIRDPVSLADVAPTLLDLARLPALPFSDGVSLVPALTGAGAVPARAGVVAESHLPRVEFNWSGLRALVTAGHKLIDAPRPELFAAADRAEARDLSRERPQELAALREALAASVRRAAAAASGDAETGASAEELERLRSLGYAASGRAAPEGPLVDRGRRDPKDRVEFLARYDKAIALSESGQVPASLPEFAALEKIEPQNLDLLLRYAQALIAAGRLDEALALMRRAVQLEPRFAIGWYRIGQLLDARRDVAGAESAYRRSIAADPLALDPRKALGSLLGDKGDLPAAIALLEDTQRLDPNDRAVLRDLERFRARAAGAPAAGPR
jgi:tetratricopeptide (TPR) repeat protein